MFGLNGEVHAISDLDLGVLMEAEVVLYHLGREEGSWVPPLVEWLIRWCEV